MSPLLLLLAGGAGFLLIFGAAVAILAGGQQDVDERLEQFVGSTTVVEMPEELEDDRDSPDMADRLDKLLSGQDFFEPMRIRISKADLKLRVSEYLLLIVIAGVVVAAAAYFFFDGSLLLAPVGLLVGMKAPGIYVGFAADRRVNKFNGQLGDTLNLWVNALRSGYSVLQAMETIATELPAPVSKEFERVVQEVRLGLSMEQALDNMLRRVPSEDLDLVITAVNIQREVGGNLAEVLDTISFTIRERVRIKGEIRTLTAQGRISGIIISLLPVALAFVLYAINGEYVSELWVMEEPFIIPNTLPCGWIVIGIGLFMIGIGAYAIRRIVDIEV